jgi:hypothetical protein
VRPELIHNQEKTFLEPKSRPESCNIRLLLQWLETQQGGKPEYPGLPGTGRDERPEISRNRLTVQNSQIRQLSLPKTALIAKCQLFS